MLYEVVAAKGLFFSNRNANNGQRSGASLTNATVLETRTPSFIVTSHAKGPSSA
jgi:hypothetical protein